MQKIIFLFVLSLTSCEKFVDNETRQFQIIETIEAELVDFKALKDNILTPKGCIGCHGDWASSEEGVDAYVVAGDPESSLLYLRVEDGTMPYRGVPLTELELELVRNYINNLD